MAQGNAHVTPRSVIDPWIRKLRKELLDYMVIEDDVEEQKLETQTVQAISEL